MELNGGSPIKWPTRSASGTRWPSNPAYYGRGFPGSVKRQVLKEEPTCRYCGVRDSVTVDHIIPLREAQLKDLPASTYNSRANAAGACRWCHDQKTKREQRRGKQRAAERRASQKEEIHPGLLP
jgi:5-methylcytosine-specific restriction endonuclease McrA